MKKAVIILVILGALASIALGATWISDYNDNKSTIDSMNELADSVDDGSNAELVDSLKVLEQAKNCGYALVVCGILAFVTVFFLGKLKKIGAVIILLAGLVPAIFDPQSLMFTFLLVIAGILAFLIKPKTDSIA